MVSVRFLGLVQLSINTKRTKLEASTVNEALKKISGEYDVKLATLKNSTILVNEKNIIDLKKFKTRLHHGDEIIILSAGGGG